MIVIIIFHWYHYHLDCSPATKKYEIWNFPFAADEREAQRADEGRRDRRRIFRLWCGRLSIVGDWMMLVKMMMTMVRSNVKMFFFFFPIVTESCFRMGTVTSTAESWLWWWGSSGSQSLRRRLMWDGFLSASFRNCLNIKFAVMTHWFTQKSHIHPGHLGRGRHRQEWIDWLCRVCQHDGTRAQIWWFTVIQLTFNPSCRGGGLKNKREDESAPSQSL